MGKMIILVILFLPVCCFGGFAPNVELYQCPEDNQSFGYSRNQVCSIKWQNDVGGYVKFSDAFSPQESVPQKISGMNCTTSMLACFQFNGHSYLICKNDVTNLTSIKRGNMAVRTFLLLPLYKKFYFDHHLSQAYILDSEDMLREFRLENLEKFWTGDGLDLRRTTFQNLLYPTIKRNMSDETVPEFIFNGTMYNLYNRRRRDARNRNFIIPFAYEPPEHGLEKKTDGPYFIILYALDIIFILILVYLYRKYSLKKVNKRIHS